MFAKMKEHLHRAVELDPGFAPAHRALGHVLKDGRWSEPEPRRRPAARPPTSQEQGRLEQEKDADKIITRYFVRVRAIFRGKLVGSDKDDTSPAFQQGRRQILDLGDPLAIPALVGVLTSGSEPTRRLLVEALAEFPQDEATMNLLVIGLLDPSPKVRRAAAIELIPRKDERVVTRLVEALRSNEEPILRNAATALGILRAEHGVEELIPLLETRVRAAVQVQRSVYLADVVLAFSHPTIVLVGGTRIIHRPGQCWAVCPDSVVGTYWTTEIQIVSIYRTEVQEALIAITGKNFGFDGDAWKQWWRTERRR
jgi:hypothetical protein